MDELKGADSRTLQLREALGLQGPGRSGRSTTTLCLQELPMMISPAGASDPYAAAAAFDRQLRSSSSDPGDAAPGSSLVAAGPDVVVTLGKGTPPGSSTYDASGRLSNGLTLD